MLLSENLKKIREEHNLTKRELCEKTGISERAYLTYEFGEREPKISVVSKLADFYNVTTDYLLGREAAPDPFGDLNLCEEDEVEVLKKYMSLPDSIRACMLDVLVQLGDAAKNRDVSPERVAGCQRQPLRSRSNDRGDSRDNVGVADNRVGTPQTASGGTPSLSGEPNHDNIVTVSTTLGELEEQQAASDAAAQEKDVG